jgi:hypothetical protein
MGVALYKQDFTSQKTAVMKTHSVPHLLALAWDSDANF